MRRRGTRHRRGGRGRHWYCTRHRRQHRCGHEGRRDIRGRRRRDYSGISGRWIRRSGCLGHDNRIRPGYGRPACRASVASCHDQQKADDCERTYLHQDRHTAPGLIPSNHGFPQQTPARNIIPLDNPPQTLVVSLSAAKQMGSLQGLPPRVTVRENWWARSRDEPLSPTRPFPRRAGPREDAGGNPSPPPLRCPRGCGDPFSSTSLSSRMRGPHPHPPPNLT